MSLNDQIREDILRDKILDDNFPGLRSTLIETFDTPRGPADPEESTQSFLRGVLNSIREHKEFKEAHNELTEDIARSVDSFLDGKSLEETLPSQTTEIRGGFALHNDFHLPISPPAYRHFKHLDSNIAVTAAHQTLWPWKQPEGLKSAMNVAFSNWGGTVSFTPKETHAAPCKIADVQAIIRNARKEGKRVRASGYRHTWSNLYSEKDHVIISMLDLKLVERLPHPWGPPKILTKNDFKTIELELTDKPNKAYVRLGAAVTNEEFRRWALQQNHWTLPLNVIMVEITIGGSNAPICHGAGIRSQTLSDLVHKIEYIDANGNQQTVSNSAHLKAASGCFGLLGIVTHITLEVDKMTYACLDPMYKDIVLAIPPPHDYKFPPGSEELQGRLKKYSKTDIEDARLKFIKIAEEKYYSEWFWFPYQRDAFINAWDHTPDETDCVDYPSGKEACKQWLAGWAGEVINNCPLFGKLSPKTQATLMGNMAMKSFPREQVKTQLINALHFRRGIQNMRVGDFEVEIPIPVTSTDPQVRDWSVIQRAWWDGLTAIYADSKNVSARIALEMRIMGHSDVTMAPQRSNTKGTASIEVITSMPAVRDERNIWHKFKQTLADKWTAYTGPDGEKLNVRPHWAKEWEGVEVEGKDWVTHMKDTSYKNEIPEFKNLLQQIGETQGWTLEDLRRTFSTPLLDRLLFE